MKLISNFKFQISNFKKGFTQHHLCGNDLGQLKKRIGLVKSSGAGFTLIELLVAISIIGILSAFLLANFVGVRQRARDGLRKFDLRQIQSAMELYRSDQATYPTSLPACGASLTFGSTTYMQKIPCDPSSGASYTYSVGAGNTTYSIIACLENGNDSQKDATNTNPPCDGTANFSYTLQNP